MRQLKGVLLAMISSSTFGLIPLFALPAMQEGGIGLRVILSFCYFRGGRGSLFAITAYGSSGYFKGVWNNVSVRRSVCLYFTFF